MAYYEGQRVISEHYDEAAKIMTRYVEKPIEEVVVKEVPKITYIDVVKQVPDVRVETVERIVEEVCIEEVIKEVPVYREEEVVKKVPVKKIVEVPVERVKEIPVDKITVREEIVEVPGDVIETERIYDVQKPLIIPRYKDTTTPMVYQQLIKPIIRQVGEDAVGPGAPHEVEVNDYDPVLCKVLVHIPKPVKLPLINLGAVKTEHKWLNSVKDYDHIVRRCNPHLKDSQLTGLLSGDSLIQPIPDLEFGGIPLIGPSPLPGTFHHTLVAPVKLPPGKPMDPKPLMNATYVNCIAREYSQLKGKNNPHVLPAISALKELRKFKYADPEYERYLKQHHQYFSHTGKMLDPVFDQMKKSTLNKHSPTQNSPNQNSAGRNSAGRNSATQHLTPNPTDLAGDSRIRGNSRSCSTSRLPRQNYNMGKYLDGKNYVDHNIWNPTDRTAPPPLATSRSSTTSPNRLRLDMSPRHRIRSAFRERDCPVHRAAAF